MEKVSEYKEVDHVNVDDIYRPGFVAVEVRQPYAYDVMEVSDRTGLDSAAVGLPSRTQQHFAEEVDINTIVKRFGLTGELPTHVPHILQGDFTNVIDFQSAMDMIVSAREAFMEQPADIRARFDNDPQKFLDFVSSKDNLDEAIKLGLVREESVQARATALKAARDAEIQAALEVELAARAKAAAAASGPGST